MTKLNKGSSGVGRWMKRLADVPEIEEKDPMTDRPQNDETSKCRHTLIRADEPCDVCPTPVAEGEDAFEKAYARMLVEIPAILRTTRDVFDFAWNAARASSGGDLREFRAYDIATEILQGVSVAIDARRRFREDQVAAIIQREIERLRAAAGKGE